jgi:threonine/homoserine/homoserine lactone efflux protein
LPAITISRRLILPGVGVFVFLLAHLAQNVWQLFHVDDIASAIRNLGRPEIVVAMGILGLVEATIVLCFYVPGTAVAIVLLLGMQPGWADALPLVAGLTVGTMAGYVASLILGRLLQHRLPSLIGAAYFHKVQSLIERYGLIAFPLNAFHPNQLAVGFAILGYFRTEKVWRYFVVGALAQWVWWVLYGFAAGLIARQGLVSSSNFQLYVAALFGVWFVYELVSRRPPEAC